MQYFWEWISVHKFEAILIALAVLAVLAIIISLIVYCVRKSKSGLFKFRRYKKYEGPPDNKQQHPKLIVEETEDKFGFMGLTESPRHGKTKNLPIKNPERGNKRKSHIRKEVRYDDKDNFFEILKNYKLSKKDKKAILKYLNNRKKK